MTLKEQTVANFDKVLHEEYTYVKAHGKSSPFNVHPIAELLDDPFFNKFIRVNVHGILDVFPDKKESIGNAIRWAVQLGYNLRQLELEQLLSEDPELND